MRVITAFTDILALNPNGLHQDSAVASQDDQSSLSRHSQGSRPSVVGLSDDKDDDQSLSTSTLVSTDSKFQTWLIVVHVSGYVRDGSRTLLHKQMEQ